MNRRDAVQALVALAAAPLASEAQQPGRTYRIGWVSIAAPRSESYNAAFVRRLTELGFIEGRNLIIEFRSAQGRPDQVPALAAELVRLKCDLLFAPGPELVLLAVEQASRDTPILIVANDYDPLATGHVAQMARPGGRVTGVSQLQAELPAKRLEILNELLPKVRRVGVLADVSTAGQLKVTQTAAALLGIELLVQEFSRTPYDYSAAFAVFARGKAEALLALTSGLFVSGRRTITALALQHRLPSMFNNVNWIESGGLLSYGPNFSATYRRAAEQVGKVLNGASPADIPVEQPNVVEMAINLKTAKALGVAIPPAMRLRADRVIEF